MNESQNKVSFETTAAEAQTISDIAFRAAAIAERHGGSYSYPFLQAAMDVSAVHANGCPLDLTGLLAADEGNFIHDVFGIRHHIDRRTGQLTGLFEPRYARPAFQTDDSSLCTCHFECRQDSHSGRWHQHEDEPCSVHPDAPMVA